MADEINTTAEGHPKPISKESIFQDKPEKNTANKTRIAPAIDEFPEKARPALRLAYTKAQVKAEQIDVWVEQGTNIVAIETHKQPEAIAIAQIVTNNILRDEDKKDQDGQIEQLVREIDILKSSYGKIASGKDASELRTTQSPFGEVSTIHFSPEEVAKYGESENIRNRLAQLVAKTTHNYKAGREKYQKSLRAIYNHRLNLLLGQAVDKYMEYPTPDYTGFKQASAFSTDDIDSLYDTAFSNCLTSARRVAVEFSGRFHYLTELEKWIENNPDRLQGFTNFETPDLQVQDRLKEDLQTAKENYQRKSQNFLDGIQRYPGEVAKNILGKLGQRIGENLGEVEHLSQAIKASGSKSPITQAVSISQEFIDLALLLEERIRSLYNSSNITAPPMPTLNYGLGRIKYIFSGAEAQNVQNEGLASSQELLYHVAPFEVVKDILRKDVLASRKAQIEKFGKSFFMSGGGIKVGKDDVEVPDYFGYAKKLTKQEYREYSREYRRLAKLPDQEGHQICFSENAPYDAYFDGVALVFSKASLFSQTQFASADGWHLFDRAHSMEVSDSPGLAIDLNKEPMMLIVVDQRRKDDFTRFIKEDLAIQPSWADRIKDPDQWIKENVVYIPDYNANTPPETIIRIWDDIRDKFFSTHHIKVTKGRIVPTGEKGEAADNSLMSLFTYQETA